MTYLTQFFNKLHRFKINMFCLIKYRKFQNKVVKKGLENQRDLEREIGYMRGG